MTAQIPEMDGVVERLSDAALPYRDPLAQIPWATLDPARAWLPERLISLCGLPEYAALSEMQKLRLSQAEFVANAELGLWLESLFLSRFTRDALGRLEADPAAYRVQLHELREEAGHSLMFLELMRRSGISRLTSVRARPRLAAFFARTIPAQSPLFWAAVFAGEAVPNAFNRLVLTERSLPEAVRALVGLHVRDENRHIVYARERLSQDMPRVPRVLRALYGPLLRAVLRQFVTTCFYPEPSVYAAAGIADPARMAKAARASATRAALVADCVAPVRQVLGRYFSLP